MKKYSTPAYVDNESGITEFGSVDVYLASEVDARIAELERENEKYEEALQRIAKWSDAYPLDVFPEPNFYTVARVLKENGLSLDQVSASNGSVSV